MTADDLSRSCVSRYEALRGGALGAPVAPELRGGLAILLRRGLWAWVRAVSAEPGSRRTPHASGEPAPVARSHDLIHLFADLALGLPRRTP